MKYFQKIYTYDIIFYVYILKDYNKQFLFIYNVE